MQSTSLVCTQNLELYCIGMYWQKNTLIILNGYELLKMYGQRIWYLIILFI